MENRLQDNSIELLRRMILRRVLLAFLYCRTRTMRSERYAMTFTQLLKGRSNSTIAITPANSKDVKKQQLHAQKFAIPEALEAKDVSIYLKKYKTLFPKDVITNSQIDTFFDISQASQKRVIRIGIIYEDEAKDSKIIDTILSDPLSLGNETWFKELVERSREDNNMFKYGPETQTTTTCKGIFQVPSPVLSSTYRPHYMKLSLSNVQNDIELWEINNKSKLAENPKLCHLYINVTKNLTNTIHQYSKELQNHILLTVVDNNEYSPSSTESTPMSISDQNKNKQHIIKIDSELCFQGINQFLKHDTKVSSQFFQSLINSNVYDLMKCIGYYLQTEALTSWLLSNIIDNISMYDSSPGDVTRIYSSLRSTVIPQFSDSVHSELQNKFVPRTNDYFKKKLRWWKLYMKNDNVEYDLKDFFNENFMNSSIEKYNYLRGKLVSQIQQQKYVLYKNNAEIANPLLKMKLDLINKRLVTEIQPFVYSSISKAFIYYQLPLSVLSFFSYQYFDFTPSSAISIALLGWVVGFNHVSKQWEKFTRIWLQNLYEDIRICVGKDCIEEGLLKELNSRYSDECELVEIKKDIIQCIKNSRCIDV